MAKVMLLLLSTLVSVNAVAVKGNIEIYLQDINGEKNPIYFVTKAEFDSLPHKNITTKTPWTEKDSQQHFSGVSLNELLKYSGVNGGTTLKMHALNDYEVSIPIEDIERYDVLLADKMNGKPLSVRNFGPYFVIYPLDNHRNELNTAKYLSRFIWQVDEITVIK